MFVEVRLYATLRRYVPEISIGVFSVEVPVNCTVTEVLDSIGIQQAEVHLIMINGVSSKLISVLHDGDRLGLFPAVGGG